MINTVETYLQMTEETEDVLNPNITFRLTEPEVERLKRILHMATQRGGSFVKKSQVFRELIGLSRPRFLTPAEIEFFRTGEKPEGLFKEEPKLKIVKPQVSREVVEDVLEKLGLGYLIEMIEKPRKPSEDPTFDDIAEHHKNQGKK